MFPKQLLWYIIDSFSNQMYVFHTKSIITNTIDMIKLSFSEADFWLQCLIKNILESSLDFDLQIRYVDRNESGI